MRRISARELNFSPGDSPLPGFLFLTLVLVGLLLGGCGGRKRTPPVATEPPAPQTSRPGLPNLIGVGLLENQDSLELTATGSALVLDGVSGSRLARLERGDRLTCSLSGGQVSWRGGGESGKAGTVILQPVDPGTRAQQGEFEYRGEFLVLPTPTGGGLTLVNSVDLEAYLRGVVPWEIGRHDRGKLAALEAQAVAARTYTISHLGTRRSRGFDVYASVQDQVYKGAGGEDDLCNEAVENTRGLVLRFDGVEIEAYYSACCGGFSSNIQEVWTRGSQPYLKSRADAPRGGGDAFCASSRHFHWRESWPAGKLEDIMQKTLPAYVEYMTAPGRKDWAGPVFSPRTGSSSAHRPGRLRDMEILERTTSGRVARMTVTTEAGVYHLLGDRVRWVLRPASGNPFILRSALFNLELIRDGDQLQEVAARGRGYGHGIGLCQTGALARAERGQSAKEILGHYYKGSVLSEVAK